MLRYPTRRAQIEEEIARTFKRHLGGRCVVDLRTPAGVALSAVGTGHLLPIAAPRDGVLARQREAVEDAIIWTPAIRGALVVTRRGGDFDLRIGQDLSIGYLSHTDTAVRLYLQETFAFLLLTTEASVTFSPTEKGDSK